MKVFLKEEGRGPNHVAGGFSQWTEGGVQVYGLPGRSSTNDFISFIDIQQLHSKFMVCMHGNMSLHEIVQSVSGRASVAVVV